MQANRATAANDGFMSRYTANTLSMGDGLRSNYIDDIFKDNLGFIWIATSGGGLSRYDGYDFLTFDVDTRPALSSNFIRKVCADKFNRLWIASEGGIDIISLDTRTTVKLKGDTTDVAALLHTSTLWTMCDNDGNIWISTTTTLICVQFDQTGAVKSTATLKTKEKRLNCSTAAIIDGNVWIGLDGNIMKTQIVGNNINTQAINISPQPTKGTHISAIYQKDNEVWIGTDHGLFRFHINSQHAKFYENIESNCHSLSQNFITSIAETNNHQLVFATLKGLNIYDPMSDSFERVTQDDNSTNSLNCNFINCMLADGDILWIGTEICGIDKFVPNELSLSNYIHSDNNVASLSAGPVNAIIEDNDRNLWVGTVEGGLNMKPCGSDNFIHFTSEKNHISHNSVSALTIDNNNRLWIGSWGGGVCVMDLKSHNHRVIMQFNPQNSTEIKSEFVGALQYDATNNGVWICTTQDIIFYDGKEMHKPIDKNLTDQMEGALGVAIDKENQLWIGTSIGLFVLDLNSYNSADKIKYRYFKSKLDSPNSKLVERITCIYPATNGTVWIGSNGYGLYRHEADGTFTAFTDDDGLCNNSVRGIVEDINGNLWISTNNGLSYFDLTNNTFSNYNASNGLPNNSFYWNATYSTTNGDIYIGGTGGLTEIHERNKITHNSNSHVVFTRLTVLNEDVEPENRYINRDISKATDIYLHEQNKSFAIEFSALCYSTPTTVKYQYRLNSTDDWIEVPASRRIASYTNIQPGDYNFEVRHSYGNNIWSKPTTINIHIKPFFYKTFWFFLLLFAVIVSVFWKYYNLRTRSLNEQKHLLHLQVEQRTKQLTVQKQLLENKTTELEEQNKLLKVQNEKITNQKETLIRMSNKIQKLTVDKLAFFTNISHEFRTPITLIIGPIERALRLSTNPKVVEQLQFVERNSRYLLQLVNQLMDFRKIESGSMTIHRENCDIKALTESIARPFAVFAGERGIKLNRIFRLNYNNLMLDIEGINKVITNLLSNAIKYTSDNGTVTIYLTSFLTDNGTEQLYISVCDTGEGIPEEDIDNIFNRFYQSYNHTKYPVYGQSGTGIGLYLCKRIVEQHQGKISAHNRKRGCAFRIEMPLIEADDTLTGNNDMANIKAIEPIDTPCDEDEESKEEQMTIMIVEDNADMRSYIRSILSEHYNVVEACNGQNAMTVMAENEVDFIICDLMMPVMDGLEFTRRIKGNLAFSHIPIVILTAQMSDEYRTESYQIGVESYLHKPFDEKMLLARIAGIVASRKGDQKNFSLSMDIDQLNIEQESNDNKFMREVMECIKHNYTNANFDVNDILKSLLCSKSLLNKKMKSLTGQTTGQFIRNYRLSIAKELILRNKDTKALNVSQIAYEVGFNDPKYFTRCFTKHYNVKPSELLYGTDAGSKADGSDNT